MTSSSNVPADVQLFLREKIPTYERLEALLLLRSRPEQNFSSASVAELLRVPEIVADKALDELRAENLVEVPVGAEALLFRYKPGNAALAEVVDRLAEAYEHDRLAIMTLMSSNAIERVRNGAIHAFANSFLVRQRSKKDG